MIVEVASSVIGRLCVEHLGSRDLGLALGGAWSSVTIRMARLAFISSVRLEVRFVNIAREIRSLM